MANVEPPNRHKCETAVELGEHFRLTAGGQIDSAERSLAGMVASSCIAAGAHGSQTLRIRCRSPWLYCIVVSGRARPSLISSNEDVSRYHPLTHLCLRRLSIHNAGLYVREISGRNWHARTPKVIPLNSLFFALCLPKIYNPRRCTLKKPLILKIKKYRQIY